MAELRSSKPTTGVRFSLLLFLRSSFYIPRYQMYYTRSNFFLKHLWTNKLNNRLVVGLKNKSSVLGFFKSARRSVGLIHNDFFGIHLTGSYISGMIKKCTGAASFRKHPLSPLTTRQFLFFNFFLSRIVPSSPKVTFVNWTPNYMLKSSRTVSRLVSNPPSLVRHLNLHNNAFEVSTILNVGYRLNALRCGATASIKSLKLPHLMGWFSQSISTVLQPKTNWIQSQRLNFDIKLSRYLSKRVWFVFNLCDLSSQKLLKSHGTSSTPNRKPKPLKVKSISFKLHPFVDKVNFKTDPDRSAGFWTKFLTMYSINLIDKLSVLVENVAEDGLDLRTITGRRFGFDVKALALLPNSTIFKRLAFGHIFNLDNFLVGSLKSGSYSFLATNNLGIVGGPTSSKSKYYIRSIFNEEFEDYIVKTFSGQFFYKSAFEPINDRYASTYMTSLINKFFSYQLGSNVITLVTSDFYKKLTFAERVRLRDFTSRLILFSSQFSTIFFLSEFIDVVYFSLKLCNLTIIVDYVQRILKKLVIWDHKKFLFFLFNLYREQMYPLFDYLGIVGLKILIKGKVGVGGNSRKRSIVLNLGSTSATSLYTSAHSMNRLLSTNTGALGFRIWMLYTKPVHPYAGRGV